MTFLDSEFDVIGSLYRIPPYRYRSDLETTPDKPDKTEIVVKAFSTGRVASLCGANGLVFIYFFRFILLYCGEPYVRDIWIGIDCSSSTDNG